MELDTIEITTKFKITIAAQKLMLPETNTYPVKAVPKLIKNKKKPIHHIIYFSKLITDKNENQCSANLELCNLIKANVHKKYNSGSICSGVDNES